MLRCGCVTSVLGRGGKRRFDSQQSANPVPITSTLGFTCSSSRDLRGLRYFFSQVTLSDHQRATMKVIDLEQVYLGYAVRRPNGRAAVEQHTEIEMGAAESEVGRVAV